jgi:hypothetical protein
MTIRLTRHDPVLHEAIKHQARLRASTTGGVDEQHKSVLNNPVGSPEVAAVERCHKCGQARPKPSEPLATG